MVDLPEMDENTRGALIVGMLKLSGRFEFNSRRGYRVWITCRNPEPLYFLRSSLGGSVSARKGGFLTWTLTGKEKVLALWRHFEPFRNENQHGPPINGVVPDGTPV